MLYFDEITSPKEKLLELLRIGVKVDELLLLLCISLLILYLLLDFSSFSITLSKSALFGFDIIPSSIRLQNSGVNISKQAMVDSESILKNIIKSDKTRQYDTVLDKALEKNSDCNFTDQIYSRIHDDPMSRRGQHIDRFDYTHFNSQAHAIERFARNENSDLQMRDAHKPILPKI